MNEIILTKETKILLIEVLKRGRITLSDAEILTAPFKIIMTKEQIDKLIDKIQKNGENYFIKRIKNLTIKDFKKLRINV